MGASYGIERTALKAGAKGSSVTKISLTITPAGKYIKNVMPDLIRHPVPYWIPAFAGMTAFGYSALE
jgi:hypothetical protein